MILIISLRIAHNLELLKILIWAFNLIEITVLYALFIVMNIMHSNLFLAISLIFY